MSDTALLVCYFPLALMSACILLLFCLRERQKPLAKNIVFLSSMMLGWQLSEIFFNLSRSEGAAFFLYDIKFPFVALSSLAILLLTLRFYGFDAYCNRLTVILLSVVPAITTLLALTPWWHDFLTKKAIISLSPNHIVVSSWEFWFWIHAGYCYALIFVALTLALTQYRKVPRSYRAASNLLLGGMAFSIACNVLVLSNALPVRLDISLVGASFCTILLYFSSHSNQGLDFLNQARTEVFNELDEAVVISDDNGDVITINLAAKYLLFRAGVPLDERSHDKVEEAFFKGAIRRPTDDEERSGVNYHFVSEAGETVYNLRKIGIHDKRGRRIGMMGVCADVSGTFAAIRRLEANAGLDALTGLLNRRTLGQRREALDRPENLPLAVITADLNDLKRINDTQGHRQGDVALRETAEALVSCCPPGASIARMGGDEFLALIPNFSREQALELIEDIRAQLAGAGASLSLGACVKSAHEQDLDGIIEQADRLMYEYKRAGKQI